MMIPKITQIPILMKMKISLMMIFLKCEIFVKWYDFFQGGMTSKSRCFGISFKNRLKWS